VKDKTIFKNGYFEIKKCRHGYFAYNTNDTFIGRSLDLYGEWTQTEIDVLLSLIHPNDIVVDVGAYIGTHTIPFAKATLPKGGVYAIEPQRMAFAFLSTNIAINNLMNVISINKFASDTIKKIKTLILDQTVAQNFGSLKIPSLKKGETVETITIDSLALSRVKLIKIDVEGDEEKVLVGATATINKYKPILYIECTNPKNSKIIISKVFDLGYQAFWHIFGYYNPDNYFGEKKNVFAEFHPEANIICFPKDTFVEQNIFIKVDGIKDTWKKAYAKALEKNKKMSNNYTE